ncbi:SIMPL domain-containing protein [Pseudalkalibacillus sp. SCS-8]|uniref:SIMPL domain-containing protein n=1 Tax=Pseudalkalibacillus nanhaiensis TaxID=3115291 RepID=UPI0032D9B814
MSIHNSGLNNVIQTFGEGEIYAPPDMIYLTIGVITEDKDVSTATKENAERSSNVLKSLQQLGVPAAHIETLQYDIQPRYDYEEGKSTLKGFRAEHLFRVRMKDVSSAGMIYDTSIQNGANVARGISFEVSDPSYYSYQAIQMAYTEALNNATALAIRMKVNLLPRPLKVEEQAPGRNGIPFKAEMLQAGGTPIQPQRVKINAMVKAWFCYQ